MKYTVLESFLTYPSCGKPIKHSTESQYPDRATAQFHVARVVGISAVVQNYRVVYMSRNKAGDVDVVQLESVADGTRRVKCLSVFEEVL